MLKEFNMLYFWDDLGLYIHIILICLLISFIIIIIIRIYRIKKQLNIADINDLDVYFCVREEINSKSLL